MSEIPLPPGWVWSPLRRLGRFKAGSALTSEDIDPEVGDFQVFGGNGPRGFTDGFTHDGTFVLIGRQGALCGNVNVARGRFWATEHAVVMTPSVFAPIGWLSRLLEWADLGRLSQSAAQPGIAVGEILGVDVPLPPEDERAAIADFLDRETAQINATIKAQEDLIERLNERRRASVNAVVFTGSQVANSAASAPRADRYEPVGFPPLALKAALRRIPDHWQVARFKAVLERVDRRNVDGDAPLMALTSRGLIIPRADVGDRQQPAVESIPRYLLVSPGNLVINPMWLVGGAVGVSRVKGAVSPDYRVFRTRGSHVPRYLHHLLRTSAYRDQYELYTRAQTTFDRRVQQADIDNLPLPVPPPDEQGAIVRQLDRSLAGIDAVIDAAIDAIALMRERRTALISATVTGRIDPRTGKERPPGKVLESV